MKTRGFAQVAMVQTEHTTNNPLGAMERQRKIQITLTEEEAYELLLRCVGNDEEDNAAFQSALNCLADAIKSPALRAA